MLSLICINLMDGLMEHGKVKWFSQEKGYGFITSSSGEDHHFNVQSINGVNLPSNGDSVSFESTNGNKGKRALRVSITSKKTHNPNNAQTRNIDYRVNCPACNKKIVPRMITYRGRAQKSICPYCAATVKTFTSNVLAYFFFGVIIIMAILSIM